MESQLENLFLISNFIKVLFFEKMKKKKPFLVKKNCDKLKK